MAAMIDLPVQLDDWIGRQQTTRDILTPRLVDGLLATLDHDTSVSEPGSEAPQGAHWLLFPVCVPMARVGRDGHPVEGGFLPPVLLPRRMWASSKVEFLQPLRVGDEIERISTIAAISPKEGRTGPLVFVSLDHVMRAGSAEVVRERQTIVYRGEGGTAGSRQAHRTPAQRSGEAWDWQRELTPDPVLLFRYSALTFNSHRIHYDRAYATRDEGYPGLVVHGPLMATLLLDFAARHLGHNALTTFEFRAVSPAFVDAPLYLRGRQQAHEVRLSVQNKDGAQMMSAKAAMVA